MKSLGIFSAVLASSLLVAAAADAAPLRKTYGNDKHDRANHSEWTKNSTIAGDPGYNVDAPDLADDCPDYDDEAELPGTPGVYPGSVSAKSHKKN